MSYSFYLYHYTIVTVIVRRCYASLTPDQMRANELLVFAVVEILSVAVALALAQFSYTYVEEPGIRWGSRLESRWRPVMARVRPAAAPQGAD
jgi:peptidoglycan/LPS O-acetylase OafA/YrhL